MNVFHIRLHKLIKLCNIIESVNKEHRNKQWFPYRELLLKNFPRKYPKIIFFFCSTSKNFLLTFTISFQNV